MLLAALAYWVMQQLIIRREGPDSQLARAVGYDWKGKVSPVIYIIAIFATLIHPWISGALYAVAALIWLIPDRRIERVLATAPTSTAS